MSGQILKKFGEKLNLQAQLHDLDASMPLRIIADVLDKDLALVTNRELTYVSKGTFKDPVYSMPNEETIFVKYYVYEADGTTLNEDYGVIEDRFDLDTSEDVPVLVPRSDEIFIELDDVKDIEVFMNEEEDIEVLIDNTDITIELEEDKSIEVFVDDREIDVELNC